MSKWWNSIGFKTKDDLRGAIRQIVSAYQLEEEMAPDHVDFLRSVLVHHANWTGKVGCGLRTFKTRRWLHSYGPTTGLVLVRSDGSEIEISWTEALQKNGASSDRSRVLYAARVEIAEQRHAANESIPNGSPCPICGRPLYSGARHVDHQPPKTFAVLISEWLLSADIEFHDIKIEEWGPVDTRFASRDLAKGWSDFHMRNATLRVIHPEENLARLP